MEVFRRPERTPLALLLPAIRSLLETQPGATVTDSGIGTWIPFDEVDDRLPALLTSTRTLAGQADS